MSEDKTRAAFMRSGMGWLRRGGWQSLLAIISIFGITGCGKHSVTPLSPYPAKITLTPSPAVSLQAGTALNFTASAQNSAGTNLRAVFTFISSDTSILNFSAAGVACAGRWDSTFTICSPAGIGVVQVTAEALNATSVPTYVFVHPPVDNITVTGIVPPNAPPLIQEPCLPQGVSMTVQARAFSQGVDVTQSVGPFTWSANNSSVVKLTPIVSSPTTYSFPTYQATATAVTPGLTEIYATASGVTSTIFTQPTLPQNAVSNPPPPVTFDFFETCPIQNIVLEVGEAGSQQTSFVASKGGTAETVVATLTDVFGNSSLPNTDDAPVLSKVPLTWTGTQPQVLSPGSGCTQSCTLTMPNVGAGAITASCSPPTCNVGFPYVPPALSTTQNLASCLAYLQSVGTALGQPAFPQIRSCEPFIPLPVYASPLNIQPPPSQPTAAISGLVTGTTAAASILAASFGCGAEAPATCQTGLYNFPTAKASTGIANMTPTPPTSLLYDLNGDKLYMGSDYGVDMINPGNLGTSTSAFTPLGTVTGNILAISVNGANAVFSDTFHTPNQVYVVSTTSSSTPFTALNIYNASAAGFSPDGLRAYIFGYDSNNNPNIFVYSALQSLQSIPLPTSTTVSSIAFSTNAAFAYAVEPDLSGVGPAVSVYNVCNDQPIVDNVTGLSYVPLAAPPVAFKVLPDGVHFIALETNGTFDYITATIAGVTPVATQLLYANSLCPQTVGHTVQNYSLNQGNITPIDFFASPDGSLLYVLASDRNSILIYNFGLTQTTGGIQLVSTSNGIPVTPLADSMSVDAGTIAVAGSDGMIHEITTANGGFDSIQVPLSDLPNYLNPFCTFTPASGPCTLDFVAVRP
jgi:hypothetical protein